MENTESKVTINEIEYVIDELSDIAKYFVAQVQDLSVQERQISARLDQVKAAKEVFINNLVKEVEVEVTEEAA
tara:strand:- start:40 stop:258 length:219 start_codon:yes stop_codon:yes gene_type:complete